MSCDNSNLESRELEPILGISCAAAFACDSIKLSKLGSGALKPVNTQQCFQNEAIPGLQPFHEEAMQAAPGTISAVIDIQQFFVKMRLRHLAPFALWTFAKMPLETTICSPFSRRASETVIVEDGKMSEMNCTENSYQRLDSSR
eukprot:scaffold1300_cov197-Chaetoceros_neogracile.AAC.5